MKIQRSLLQWHIQARCLIIYDESIVNVESILIVFLFTTNYSVNVQGSVCPLQPCLAFDGRGQIRNVGFDRKMKDNRC